MRPGPRCPTADPTGVSPENQAFIADPGVKRLDIAVTPRLPRRDKTQPDTLPGPVGHRGTRQLRAVIAAQHSRVATHDSEAVEFVDEDMGGDRAIDQPAQAFPGVLIDDGHDLDRAPIGGGVELEIHRPHPVRGIRSWRRCCGADAQTFAPSALRHPQALLTPQPLNLLVVHDPALAAGVVVGAPESPPRMGFRVLAKPRPQPGVGI